MNLPSLHLKAHPGSGQETNIIFKDGLRVAVGGGGGEGGQEGAERRGGGKVLGGLLGIVMEG